MRELCRAVRPLAAGEPTAACRQFMPSVSRAARPSAVSELFMGHEAGYAEAFRGRSGAAEAQHSMRQVANSMVACAAEQVLEQAPNPSFERTANGGTRLRASAGAKAPLSAAQVKR